LRSHQLYAVAGIAGESHDDRFYILVFIHKLSAF
jgi:hypothetical protein